MSPWLSDLLLRSQTDERLITLAQLGHKRAFELIADRYGRSLTAYARRIDPRRAEDLVQQTFLSALSALQNGTEVRHLRGWLYEILRNQARREYATSPALAELDEADSVTESAQHVAERRMMAVDALGAVAQLPARQHAAIVQMAFQGQSRTEVADSMGLSEGAVRQLVHRARATVRAAVTAVIPMPVLRWIYSPRAGSAGALTDATFGAGAASGAGLALKVSVGAIVASGLVATGVIPVVSPRHRPTRLASRSQSTDIRAAAGRQGPTTSAGIARSSLGGSAGVGTAAARSAHSHRALAGGASSGPSQPLTATVISDSVGTRTDRGGGSGSGGSTGGQSGSSGSGSGPGSGDGGSSGHGSGSGSSGPGSGDHGSGGSDGGPATSGGGTDGGGGSGTGTSDHGGSTGTDGGGSSDGGPGSSGSPSGTDGGGTSGGPGPSVSGGDGYGTATDGGGSQPDAVTSGHDGGSSGGDGGTATSGSGGDGTSSGSGSGTTSGGH